MADFEVRGRVSLKDDASPVAKRATLSFANLRDEIGKRLVLTAGDLVRAFRLIPDAIKAVTNAFAEQEQASAKLATALRSLGPAAADVQAALEAQATALQKSTQFGDEAIINGQALLASFSKNTEAIKGATQAAVDLSAATGQDLNSAFLLLGKALAGETSTLSRYGIILDESLPKSEKFAAALEKIQKQFGGQAAAQAQTFTGQVAQLKNAFGDFQEELGRFIVDGNRSVGVLGALKDATDFWTDSLKRGAADLDSVQGRQRDFAAAQRELALAQAAVTAAQDEQIPGLRTLQGLAQEAVFGATNLQRAQAALVDAENRLAAARKANTAEAVKAAEQAKAAAIARNEEAEAAKALADAFDALGVKSKEFSETAAAGVRRNLELIHQSFLDGATTAKEYGDAVAAAAEKLRELGDAATLANDRIKANADEMVAAQERLSQSFRDEDDAAESANLTLEETADGYEAVADAANSAAAGIRQVTSARSDDARTDVQIAQDNLAALDALGPFASGFTSTGGFADSLGARSALQRKLSAAKAAEGSGPEVGGSTVGLGARGAVGLLGGGSRSLAGR